MRPNGVSAHTRLDNWSASRAIIKVRVCVCRSDLSAHLSILPQPLGETSGSCSEPFASSKHGPDYPCVLIGDRNRGPVMPAPRPKSVDPHATWVGLSSRCSNNSSSTMNEEGPEMLTAAFADAHEDPTVATGVLAWHEA